MRGFYEKRAAFFVANSYCTISIMRIVLTYWIHDRAMDYGTWLDSENIYGNYGRMKH